jgi:hypothetical protein
VCLQADYMADDVDDQTSDRFLEVYLLWLFGWVLFCESAGDFVSRCMIPWAQRIADAPLEQMPQISWSIAVLAATYRGLCSAVMRPTSREAILLGALSCSRCGSTSGLTSVGPERTSRSTRWRLTAPTQRTSPPWVPCGVSGR